MPLHIGENLEGGVVVYGGIADGFIGNAPDIGAFEFGTVPWKAGFDFKIHPIPSILHSIRHI
jgi:hypothetical protein